MEKRFLIKNPLEGLITDAQLVQLLKQHSYDVSVSLSISWIIRFSVTSKTRQVIINKGYILQANVE
jgi:hypothetical protein